jgi:hypothetical protein
MRPSSSIRIRSLPRLRIDHRHQFDFLAVVLVRVTCRSKDAIFLALTSLFACQPMARSVV